MNERRSVTDDIPWWVKALEELEDQERMVLESKDNAQSFKPKRNLGE